MSKITKLIELLNQMASYPDNNVAADAVELRIEIEELQARAKTTHGCSCQGWGCYSCCSSEAELRQRQGTFS
jgi:hypothetical protein